MDAYSKNKFKVDQQIKGQQEKHEAFHALINLIAPALQDEAIKLWSKGTNAAANEHYYRRTMLEELTEGDYNEAQEVVRNAWKKMLNIA